MSILLLFGLSVAVDPFSRRDHLVESLRQITPESAPEKAYFVDQVEDMLTEMAFCSSGAQDVVVMDAFASFSEHVILLNDIEERTVNKISKIVSKEGIMMRGGYSFPETLSPIDLLIRLEYDVLTQTNIDMFELILPGTIPHQDVIYRILKNIASSTFAISDISIGQMGRMTDTQLAHIENLSFHLMQDCHRIMHSNPGSLIHCVPMYLLFRMDVSDIRVEDLLIGDELVEVEALVWDHLGFENNLPGMMRIYEKIIEKRRINRAEVSRILVRARGHVSQYQNSEDFYYREIMNHLDRVEQASESDTAVKAFVQHDMSFPPTAVSDLILNAALGKCDPSVEHVSFLMHLMPDWRARASSYDKLRMSYWVITSGAVRPWDREYFFFEGLASEFNIIIGESRFLRFLGTSDPRVIRHGKSLREADFSDEKASETFNRFRRLSLEHKSLAPFFEEFCCSLVSDSYGELRYALLTQFEVFESTLAAGYVLDAAFNPPIPSFIREFAPNDFELLRNPVEATFKFLNALAPADFEDLSRNFRNRLTGLRDLLKRLNVVLRIVAMEEPLSAIVAEIEQKLRRILNEKIHIPWSIIGWNGVFQRMLRAMFPSGNINKLPYLAQAEMWNRHLDLILHVDEDEDPEGQIGDALF
jgi:hypothetical protein